MRLTPVRDLAVEAPLASGHAFLSAASGLVVLGNRLCVVADDAHCLALFVLGNAAPGTLVQLIDGDLPEDAAQRKRVKPDFEILVALPGAGVDRVLALGSGSTPRRMRGAVVDLPAAGGPPSVRPIDLQPLFAALGPLVPEVNLEGAVVDGERLLLFNRGNMRFPASHVIEVPLAAVVEQGPGMVGVAATLRAELTLPEVSGVPLTVTDACRLDNGHILLAAVAEATADSYADGALAGAAIVELGPQFALHAVHPLDPPCKIEGLAARPTRDGLQVLCVTDADDPELPSALYAGIYPGAVGAAR